MSVYTWVAKKDFSELELRTFKFQNVEETESADDKLTEMREEKDSEEI